MSGEGNMEAAIQQALAAIGGGNTATSHPLDSNPAALDPSGGEMVIAAAAHENPAVTSAVYQIMENIPGGGRDVGAAIGI